MSPAWKCTFSFALFWFSARDLQNTMNATMVQTSTNCKVTPRIYMAEPHVRRNEIYLYTSLSFSLSFSLSLSLSLSPSLSFSLSFSLSLSPSPSLSFSVSRSQSQLQFQSQSPLSLSLSAYIQFCLAKKKQPSALWHQQARSNGSLQHLLQQKAANWEGIKK